MAHDEITPVAHTSGSEFGTKAAGTAGGALKGGIGAALLWIVGITAAFICLGVFIGSGGLAAMFAGHAAAGAAGSLGITHALGAAGSGIASFLTNPATLWGAGLGVVGAAIATGTAWIPGGLGAIFGGLGGHAKASHRVEQERAAAMQMQYEMAAMQAQAAQAAPAAPVASPLPEQGSRFNQAASAIQANSVQLGSTIDQRALAAGRA